MLGDFNDVMCSQKRGPTRWQKEKVSISFDEYISLFSIIASNGLDIELMLKGLG